MLFRKLRKQANTNPHNKKESLRASNYRQKPIDLPDNLLLHRYFILYESAMRYKHKYLIYDISFPLPRHL